MLPLTKNRRFRISNRMAVLAAILLVITSVAGLGGSARLVDQGVHQASLLEAAEETPAMIRSASASRTTGKKGFKINLFLFRNH